MSGGPAAWKWLLLPWMAVVTWMAYVWAQPLQQFMEPESARIIFWHVPMAWLGLLWFIVGAVHGFRFLYGRRRGEAALDRKGQHANEMGLICTVLATTTGMVFAARQWGTPWNWDPKQVAITILIVLYMAYFGLRMSVTEPELRARLSAAYSIFGAVSTPVLFWVIPQLPVVASLHPPGTTITGGLDGKWRLIYWMAFVGFLGITLWAYELRLRAAEAEERLETGAATAPGTEPRLEARRKPALDA